MYSIQRTYNIPFQYPQEIDLRFLRPYANNDIDILMKVYFGTFPSPAPALTNPIINFSVYSYSTSYDNMFSYDIMKKIFEATYAPEDIESVGGGQGVWVSANITNSNAGLAIMLFEFADGSPHTAGLNATIDLFLTVRSR